MVALLAPRPKTLEIVKNMIVGPGGKLDQLQYNEAVEKALMIDNAGPSQVADDAWDSIGKAFGIGPQVISPQQAYGAALQQMQSDLAKAGIEVGKEIDFNTFTDAIPNALGFNVFDLSGPARITAPFLAPFRSKIPRVLGRGPSALAKVITGFSGSATGGIGAVSPFFNLEVPNAGSNVEAARGNPVSYATGDVIVPFAFSALRDAVTMPAQFSAEGFQDLRGMSSALKMQMAMMAEERALIMGRSAALATPAQPTGTARAVVAGVETGILGTGAGGTNVYARVTAIGPFGETASSPVSAAVNIAAAATNVVDFTWADVTGALGYNVYVGYANAGGGDPGAALSFLDYIVGAQQSTGFNVFTAGVFGRRSTGPTAPLSDTGTGSAISYRGIIQTVEEGPISGSTILGGSGRLNTTQGTDANVAWLQAIFASMWQNAKADPEEILMNAREIQNISKIILSGTTSSNYRIAFDPAQANGIIAGVAVSAVLNESTQKPVKLTTHPWLPFGNAVVASYALPFPTAFGQTTTMEVKGPQDYMEIAWPLTTLRWESTILWMNALVVYAPTFFWIEHGIAQSATAAAGAQC